MKKLPFIFLILIVTTTLLLGFFIYIKYYTSTNTVEIINNSKKFTVNYTETDLFNNFLKSLNIENSLPNKNSIRKLKIFVTDEPQSYYQVSSKGKVNIITSGDSAINNNFIEVKIQLDIKDATKQELNNRFLFTIINILGQKNDPSLSQEKKKDIISQISSEFYKKQEKNPFTINIINTK